MFSSLCPHSQNFDPMLTSFIMFSPRRLNSVTSSIVLLFSGPSIPGQPGAMLGPLIWSLSTNHRANHTLLIHCSLLYDALGWISHAFKAHKWTSFDNILYNSVIIKNFSLILWLNFEAIKNSHRYLLIDGPPSPSQHCFCWNLIWLDSMCLTICRDIR